LNQLKPGGLEYEKHPIQSCSGFPTSPTTFTSAALCQIFIIPKKLSSSTFQSENQNQFSTMKFFPAILVTLLLVFQGSLTVPAHGATLAEILEKAGSS
jgi:hypothetical protein